MSCGGDRRTTIGPRDRVPADRVGREAVAPFAGSPTIGLDGLDAFGDAVPVTDLAFRLDSTETGSAGLPTVEQLTEALRAKS